MKKPGRNEIRKRMQEILASLAWEPEASVNESSKDAVELAPMEREKGWVKVRDIHKKLLRSALENPFSSISEHSERLGNVSPWLVLKTIAELIQIGFMERPLSFSLGKRGNPRKYLRATEKGARFAGMKLEQSRYAGRGDFEHCLYQHLVKEWLEKKGRQAIIEFSLNSKSIDVAEFEADGRIRVFEVELRAIPHIIENITKDLAAGCSEVVIVTRNRVEQKRVTALVYSELAANKAGRVSFKTIGEFVE
jgi:hypothetical protein